MPKPLLDFSDILTDPDLVDTTLTVSRNVQTVGSNGLAVDTPTITSFAGVVSAGKGSSLRRGDAGARIEGDIEIATLFTLVDGRTGTDADVVTWNGRQYTVTVVKDMSTYGAGFVIATCDLVSVSGG